MRAGYSAVDIVGHVNNSRYIEWICDAFPYETFSHRKIDWLQINYDHEVRPGEEVAVLVNAVDHDPDLWALEGRIVSSDTRSFEALVRWQD
jgi:acyl-ACP thioesterase